MKISYNFNFGFNERQKIQAIKRGCSSGERNFSVSGKLLVCVRWLTSSVLRSLERMLADDRHILQMIICACETSELPLAESGESFHTGLTGSQSPDSLLICGNGGELVARDDGQRPHDLPGQYQRTVRQTKTV